MPSSVFDEYLESKITLETESIPLPEDQPFHLLMMGNWGGSSDFLPKNLSERKFIEIDRDSFDDIMRKMTPQVILDFDADTSIKLTFECLDDFHPDSIFQRVSLFSDLRKIRQNLKKPDTFDEAAREVYSWYTDSEVENKPQDTDSKNLEISFGDNLLDQILDNKKSNSPVIQSHPKTPLGEFVGNIIAPYIVKTDVEEQSKLLAIVDEVISDLMRKILHHRDFQELESAWRGLFFLVRRVETGNKLKVFFIHLTKSELLSNLSEVNSLEDSQFYKILAGDSLLSDKTSYWSAVFGNYEFSLNIENIAALIRISKIAQTADCPFLSQISPEIFGAKSFSDFSDDTFWKVDLETPEYKLWATLRAFPESNYLGLSLNKFIGRLPYGNHTEPTEVFDFEEFSTIPEHSEFLWINPSFAYAYGLAREFSFNGWDINLDNATIIDNMPLYFYESEGSTIAKSCAEIDMTETAYISILNQGLMALSNFRGEDKIRLSSIKSVSNEYPDLKGKWLL